jgi:hypothetical protein
MNTSIVKLFLVVITLSLAVPESYAKRMGSGRSVGKQSQMSRQRAQPRTMPRQQPAPPPVANPQPMPASPAPLPRSQPGMARQAVPPTGPMQTVPRQASSPWGGMLGGVLVGLGLGSLMSSGDRNAQAANQNNANENAENRTSGGSADGTTASGADQSQANLAQSVEQPQQSRLGSGLLLGIFALAAFFLVRRARARASGRRV